MKENKAVYSEAMVSSMRAEMVAISQFIPIPYVVFLADEEGWILDLICSSRSLQENMDHAGLGAGINLSKRYSGLNAVSLAMEMNLIGVVRGMEHTDASFQSWNCVCAPLSLDGGTLGYVDISFDSKQPIDFAIPFVQQLADNVAYKRMVNNASLQKFRLDMVLSKYKLTAREKEVAALWLTDKSALHISSALGISEGSVRNVVKSIYIKMNVNDRSHFAKKLI
ncbi:LuxR C-terminal-related transcriptional regulator [Paenibacillus sp. sgz5001063]|uniref:LuxR C-terminal-related transcriptional regulator n=1 Tax=Paenibacillus sp. sgz5001063 TaxID=3242474 RepID=UPI0036D32FA3